MHNTKNRRGFKMEVYLISLLAIFLISTVVWKVSSFEKNVKEEQESTTLEVEERPPLLLLEALDRNLVQLSFEGSTQPSIEGVEILTLGASIENEETEVETTVKIEPETTSELVTEVIPTTEKEMSIEELKNFFYEISEYTDMSENLGISKDRFVEIINALPYDYENVFKDNADCLWETAKKYDFNEFLMVGIMALESGWGSAPVAPNNYSSQRKSATEYYSYGSPEEGIEVLAKNLANNYLAEDGKYHTGNSLHDIGTIYCEGDEWASDVSSCIYMVLREYFKTR